MASAYNAGIKLLSLQRFGFNKIRKSCLSCVRKEENIVDYKLGEMVVARVRIVGILEVNVHRIVLTVGGSRKVKKNIRRDFSPCLST